MYTINSFTKPKVYITMNDIINNAKEASQNAYNEVIAFNEQLEGIHIAYKSAILTAKAMEKVHDEACAHQLRLIDKAKAANAYASSLLNISAE